MAAKAVEEDETGKRVRDDQDGGEMLLPPRSDATTKNTSASSSGRFSVDIMAIGHGIDDMTRC